jgi:hypothetical protein
MGVTSLDGKTRRLRAMESHRTCPIQRSDEGWHGRLVPKAGTFCSWCHQSFRAADDQTEVGEIERSWGRSWGHPPEVGATPQSTRTMNRLNWGHPSFSEPGWCHPTVRLRQGRPASPKQKPKTVPPLSSEPCRLVPPLTPRGTSSLPELVPPVCQNWCHPSVLVSSADRSWGHPPIRADKNRLNRGHPSVHL